MNNAKIKSLLVDKGERYGLIAAGGVMLMFLILGIMQLSGSPNPETYIDTVDKNTKDMNNKINGAVAAGTVKELPDHIKNPKADPKYKSSWVNNLFFDPFAPPDRRRVNPTALAVTDSQLDFMWAKIVAYDMRDPDLWGVLVKPKSTKNDKAENEFTPAFLQELKLRFKLKNIQARPNPAPPGNGGLGQGVPPGPGGGAMQPGQRGQGKGRHEGALVDEGPRLNVQYVNLDPEKMKDYRFALTILPRRMVIVQAALPYKAQIEEIQKALRLQDPNDVFSVYRDEAVPQYRGFVVERQTLGSDGKEVVEPWAKIELQQSYREIFKRHFAFEEDPKTNFVLLHWGHSLTMPLPTLMGQKYPDIRIPELKQTIQTQEAMNKPPEALKVSSQFDNDVNIFNPGTASSAATAGQPNLGAGGINIQRAPNLRDADPAKAGATQPLFKDLPEYVLVRAVDTDVLPGYIYKYRIKVVLQNPNWVGEAKEKKDPVPHPEKYVLVSRPSDADIAEISSPWTEVKGSVSVPREDFLFAIDPDPKEPRRLKEGQGLLQIQRWMANITAFGNNKEPIGDWVVADVVATRGTYLGGKQFVNLPLWASEFNHYILRPVEGGRKENRRGVLTDPTLPGRRYAVVEVEGGECIYRPPTKSITMHDETATEILLMDDDGVLQVRSSFADRFDDSRARREDTWKAWIERTAADTKTLDPEKQPGGDKDFK